MKKWVLKAAIQKIISFLPHSHKLNFWFQKNITKGVALTENHFNDKLTHCSDHLIFCSKTQKNINELNIFEIGTGWYPVVPIGFFLNGAQKIYSIDISPLCTKERLLKTIDKFIEWKEKGALEIYIPNLKKSRWEKLLTINRNLSFNEILSSLHIELLIGDARKTNFNKYIDCVVSNNVLEHIYPNILKEIINESNRILKPNGIQSHFIDMSDHFAHSDNSISVYNFLKYDDFIWKLIDNSVQPQNRLRLSDYQEIFKTTGRNLTLFRTRKGNLNALEEIKLNSKYSLLPKEMVAITHTHAVLS